MSTDPLAPWLERREQCRDRLDSALVARLAATLGQPCPADQAPLPPLWHWAFFQLPTPPEGIGDDGHPTRGGFLPPAEGRQRMWAGGEFEFLSPLRVACDAERHSRVASIEEKSGRSGSLLFVAVEHEYHQAGSVAIRETQRIVYRQPSAPKLALDEPMPPADWSRTVQPDPVLLFRYSAATFNGHRIHYDWPYATATEGYPGLVVHGPLIATLLLHAFSQAHPEATPRRLRYRGLRPLFADRPFEVGGRLVGAGQAELTAGNADGPAQRATLEFDTPADAEAARP